MSWKNILKGRQVISGRNPEDELSGLENRKAVLEQQLADVNNKIKELTTQLTRTKLGDNPKAMGNRKGSVSEHLRDE